MQEQSGKILYKPHRPATALLRPAIGAMAGSEGIMAHREDF